VAKKRVTAEQPVDERRPVPDVIESLLRVALPTELHALIPRLLYQVTERPHVSEHAQKVWGELSEADGNIIAREVGLVARTAIDGVLPAGRGIH
jgi:hypothetical protein